MSSENPSTHPITPEPEPEPEPEQEGTQDEGTQNDFSVIFYRQDLTNPRNIRSIGLNRSDERSSSLSFSNDIPELNNEITIDNYRSLFSNYLVRNLMLEFIQPQENQNSNLITTGGQSFWDPIKVGLTLLQAEEIPTITKENPEQCFICTEEKTVWRNLPCNDKHMVCNSCFLTWFSENVKCPYCKTDLRTILESKVRN